MHTTFFVIASALGASFAENFYGLKRRRRPLFETERARTAVGTVLAEEKLRSREIGRSLLTLVCLVRMWLMSTLI